MTENHASPPRPQTLCWQLARRSVAFFRNEQDGFRPPRLMGIVNVTPDSFSDGGCFFEKNAALEHAMKLAEDGADFLDIGGESTRPGSLPVPQNEELNRVIPLVSALSEQLDRRFRGGASGFRPVISVDTNKAVVAREAVAAGAEVVNDISSLRFDPSMLRTLRETEAGVCVMHMQGHPKTMQLRPHYPGDDPVPTVVDFLKERIDFLVSHGIPRSRIAIDPGLGFGKTREHNLRLVRETSRLHESGCPVLVGHSRKRFLGEMLGNPDLDRDAATVLVSLFLAARNVHVLRVHDVAAHRRAWEIMRQLDWNLPR